MKTMTKFILTFVALALGVQSASAFSDVRGTVTPSTPCTLTEQIQVHNNPFWIGINSHASRKFYVTISEIAPLTGAPTPVQKILVSMPKVVYYKTTVWVKITNLKAGSGLRYGVTISSADRKVSTIYTWITERYKGRFGDITEYYTWPSPWVPYTQPRMLRTAPLVLGPPTMEIEDEE